VRRFGKGVLAVFGLPPLCLTAADQPRAFRFLAMPLVPTPRPVLAAAPFAQTGPLARSAPSGLRTVLSFNLVVAHGRLVSQGESSGRMWQHFPRALSKRETDD